MRWKPARGSADVVSGYFDHWSNLAAKKQELQAFVVYDRYPGRVLVVSQPHNSEIKSIKDLAGRKSGVSAPVPRPILFSNSC